MKQKLTSFTNLVFFYLSLRLLVDGMEEFLIQPTAWYYVRYLGQSNLYLGFLLGAFSVGSLVFAPCIGAFDVRFKAPKIVLLMCGITKFFGNLLYTIPTNACFPMIGRFMSGIGEGTVGVMYGAIAHGTNNKNRAQAFLYFEGLYSVGTSLGPIVGSLLTFNIDILGWTINAGNSPGLLLTIIWFLLLFLTIFLPSDLTGRKSRNKSNDENETEIDNNEYSMSRICCSYFVLFQTWAILNFGSFYLPLIAVHHLGLGLAEIKLIYINGALFSFVLFLSSYVLSGFLHEKTFIAIGIISQILPLTILFYFALTWDEPNLFYGAYFLLILMIMLSVSFVIFPLGSSLLSSETPKHKASLYQSIAFAVLHLPNVICRILAGATFNRTGMTYVSVSLAVGLFVEFAWFLVEYRNLFPASKKEN